MTILDDSPVSDFVKHYGGMDVPVANGVSSSPQPVTNWNDIADRAMYRLKSVGCDPKYADVDLTKNAQLMKDYDIAVAKAFNDCLTSCGILAVNKINDNAFTYIFDRKDQSLFPMKLAVVHQAAFKECPKFYINFDDKGFIVGVKADIPEEASASLAQSDLKHHGVKGQKWGTRKARRADKKWQANIYSVHGAIAVHNAVADRMNSAGGLQRLNNNPKYKNKPLLDDYGRPVSKAGSEYLKEYNKLNEQYTHEAVRQVHGVSPSGQYKARLDTSNRHQWRVVVSNVAAGHVDGDIPDLIFEVDHDSNGFITNQRMIQTSMAQRDTVSDYLKHHGVKGQKWGVRNRLRKGIRTSKQRNTTFKKTPNRLTDAELSRRIKRLELEKKYSDLNKPTKSSGKTYVHSLLENSGRTVAGAVVGGAAGFFVQRALKSHFGDGAKKVSSKAAIKATEKFLKKHPGGFT